MSYTGYVGLLKLSNVESDSHKLWNGSDEKSWSNKYLTVKKRDASGIFLVIDEFAALRIALD